MDWRGYLLKAMHKFGRSIYCNSIHTRSDRPMSAMDPMLVRLSPLPCGAPPALGGVVTPRVLDPLGLCSSSALGASLMVDRFLAGCSTH